MASPGGDEAGIRLRRRSTATTRMSVEFHTRHEVLHIRHLSDMTDDEVTDQWLLGADFDAFQRDMVKAVRAMRRGEIDESPSNPNPRASTRGLEHLRSAAHLEQRKINKDCVSQAVLGEQERQRAERRRDEEGLRSASERASLWSRDLARTMGAEDAAFVESQRRTARAALRSARAAAAAASTSTAAVESTPPNGVQQVDLSEKPSSRQCFSVLGNALALSEAPSCRGDATNSAAAHPPSNSPASAAYEMNTCTYETEVKTVAIRPPGSSSGGGTAGTNSNIGSSSIPAEGNGFLGRLRGLKSEAVRSVPRPPQQGKQGQKSRGGVPNVAVASLRTMLTRQSSGDDALASRERGRDRES